AVGNEGELDDGAGDRPVADHGGHAGALPRLFGRQEAEGNRRLEGRGEAAGGDAADGFAGSVDQRRTLARRQATVELDADAPAGGAIGQFTENALRAREVGALAPALRYRKVQTSLDRGDRLVEVVAVERQPRLEPQRVA